jgi:hypothetical protein
LLGLLTNAEDCVKNAMSNVVIDDVMLVPVDAAAQIAAGPQLLN